MARHQAGRQRALKRPVPVSQWSAPFLASLASDMGAFLQSDLAVSTRRTYDSHVKQFAAFCQRQQVPVWPSSSLVARFIMGRTLQGYSLSTIELGVAALTRLALDWGAVPLADALLVRRALKAAARHATRGKVQKLPLALSDMRTLVRRLGAWLPSPFMRARDRALFLLGWAGMLRSAELVALAWEHVKFVPGHGVIVFVPSSKTDPGERAWVFVALAPDRLVCPVRALRSLQSFGFPAGPVFRPTEGAQSALCKTTVGIRLQTALRQARVPWWSLYSAHSLRRGGATHASLSGVSFRMIQVMGRWRSDAVRQYLYCSPSQLWAASRQLLSK